MSRQSGSGLERETEFLKRHSENGNGRGVEQTAKHVDR